VAVSTSRAVNRTPSGRYIDPRVITPTRSTEVPMWLYEPLSTRTSASNARSNPSASAEVRSTVSNRWRGLFAPNSSARSSSTSTGRPAARASAAASTSCSDAFDFDPNPPPTATSRHTT
jgi:hypothetical protein